MDEHSHLNTSDRHAWVTIHYQSSLKDTIVCKNKGILKWNERLHCYKPECYRCCMWYGFIKNIYSFNVVTFLRCPGCVALTLLCQCEKAQSNDITSFKKKYLEKFNKFYPQNLFMLKDVFLWENVSSLKYVWWRAEIKHISLKWTKRTKRTVGTGHWKN